MNQEGSTDIQRVTVVLHSGAYDRASYALSIALVALASGMEVHMLLTFEGLRRFTKGHLTDIGEETFPRVRANIERGLASGGIQSLKTQLADAKKLGLKLYACPNAMAALNIPISDVLDEVDNVMGLAAFLELAGTAAINWYI
ncbi:MAG: DsrE/DsrF/DrsH-like family protein [Dehalococcoidales bacterium]|nr:DsrE/DsrF/DrsH-like family protein [Dehalococcoidales bacterium]MDP6825256.1 DsrE/DsrF/DrsH-like family protein [Dehalococcoidales bacterium]